MRWLLGLIALILLVAPPAKAQVGALQTDCRLGGDLDDGLYQFVATCAGAAPSPDGRFVIVQRAYSDEQPPIELQDARGRVLMKLHSVSDDMPFAVGWAPNSRWFFVNLHVGSFMDVIHLFEIVDEAAVERPALREEAVRIAVERYPCLPPEMVLPNAVRWSRDSRQLVLVTISAPYACTEFGRAPGTFESLWMIGDVETGQIDPSSIQPDTGETLLEQPRDGPYAGL